MGISCRSHEGGLPARACPRSGVEERWTLKKIGRNDPCPCGSGEKYKKCCLDRPGPILPFFHRFLTYEEVDDMSTEDIIQRLDSIGGCV